LEFLILVIVICFVFDFCFLNFSFTEIRTLTSETSSYLQHMVEKKALST